jgi:hypothetical protein
MRIGSPTPSTFNAGGATRNVTDLRCLVLGLDPVIVMPFKPKLAMLHLFLNGLLRFS